MAENHRNHENDELGRLDASDAKDRKILLTVLLINLTQSAAGIALASNIATQKVAKEIASAAMET